MNKKFKKALQTAFEAPPPRGKEPFIKALHFPKTTYRNFLFSQMCYIRKRVWVAFFVIVLLASAVMIQAQTFIDYNAESWKIWSISAILPLLAILTVAEIYRSTAYRMAELEVSCRYSLLQIITARITILGVGNFIVLISLLLFLSQVSTYNILQLIVYLMVPYLIVCSICLWILNHVNSHDGIYVCATTVCLICVTTMLFKKAASDLYKDTHLNTWIFLFIFGILFAGYEIHKLLKQMEEQVWNLLSIE